MLFCTFLLVSASFFSSGHSVFLLVYSGVGTFPVRKRATLRLGVFLLFLPGYSRLGLIIRGLGTGISGNIRE